MELLFSQSVQVSRADVNAAGELKLSALLHYAQEAAGGHCQKLGLDWETMQKKGLFWAVLRHRAQIQRLPNAGDTITVETWPLPTTRSAFPRAVRALDAEGKILFDVMSLWVLMDPNTRAMILPGKSGVDVPGIQRPDQADIPGSIPPGQFQNAALWHISPEDLDRNGHVNNARYLDQAEQLSPAGNSAKGFTVCYLSEALPGEEISMTWEQNSEGILQVDGRRVKTDVSGGTERVFALRVEY